MNLEDYESYITTHLDRGGNGKSLALLALGLAGEVGEVIEPIKKSLAGTRELDKDELLLELGDVMAYLTLLSHYYGFTMSEVMEANKDKLIQRDKSR